MSIDYPRFEDFQSILDIQTLVKEVGKSQYTDGVRIEESYHKIFNPADSPDYVARGKARSIRVLFNNKVFGAEYRYEGQSDITRHLESIRFKQALKKEFKKVYPDPTGCFTIQAGKDLNHFVFNIIPHISSNLTQYWVFHANLNTYNIIEALRNNVLKAWSVKQHRDEIKKGDKVILWAVGKDHGCYALATITSDVIKRKDIEAAMNYYTKERENIEAYRCELSFEYILVGNPITKESIKENSILKNFNIGLQGTNFSATKEEYEELRRIAMERSSEESYQSEVLPIHINNMPDSPPPTWNEIAERRVSSIFQRLRSPKEGAIALSRADFKCEVDNSHVTFKTERGLCYMEKHHLIPMEAENQYKKDIDHSYNIYSLCPNCHRKIHHGSLQEKRLLIEYLFRQREDQYLKEYETDLDKILTHY